MLKAIVIALTLAVGIFAAPSAKSEKEILPLIVTASAEARPSAPTREIVLVTVAKPVVHVAKKKLQPRAKKKVAKKKPAHAGGKPKLQTCAPNLDEGLVKLHGGNNDYGKISPNTAPFHLTSQPPCA